MLSKLDAQKLKTESGIDEPAATQNLPANAPNISQVLEGAVGVSAYDVAKITDFINGNYSDLL